jgi:thiamine-monophosphate kinase
VRRDADPVRVAREMARGMANLARRHRCALVGGNVTRAPAWSISVTAIGEAERPRGRRGAKPGDKLVVAGELGRAALGLRLLQRNGNDDGSASWAGRREPPRRSREETAAIRAQLRPEPLVTAGLAANGLAVASVDVSDGFLRDLGHLCDASRCGSEVELSALPIDAVVRESGIELALGGGEDYALLFAVRPRDAERLVSAIRRTKTNARVVGRFVKDRGIRLRQDGSPRPLPPTLGWDHLA